jgi:hypothetical protein
MSFAIEVSQLNGRVFFNLTSSSNLCGFVRLLDGTLLPAIKTSKWYVNLKEHDGESLLGRISDDQLIVAIAFYLNDYTSSKDLMIRWFQDSGLNFNDSKKLSDIVYSACLSKDGLLPDLDLPKLTDDKPLELSFFIQLLKENQALYFLFEQLPVPINNDVYNLSQTPETHFIIEDHNCIITGFSVNYTSFVEILSGYSSHLLNTLCNLIPVEERDTLSVFRLFSTYRDEINPLLLNVFNSIEYFGINGKGKLIKFDNSSNLNDKLEFIPLYIKMIK